MALQWISGSHINSKPGHQHQPVTIQLLLTPVLTKSTIAGASPRIYTKFFFLNWCVLVFYGICLNETFTAFGRQSYSEQVAASCSRDFNSQPSDQTAYHLSYHLSMMCIITLTLTEFTKINTRLRIVLKWFPVIWQCFLIITEFLWCVLS